MKKIIALMMISMLLTCSAAFGLTIPAGQIIAATNSDSSYTLPSFAKLSTGVSLGYSTSTGTYAIITKHVNGDKQYGAAANDGKNYWMDAAVGSGAAEPGASDSSAFSGWSSL